MGSNKNAFWKDSLQSFQKVFLLLIIPLIPLLFSCNSNKGKGRIPESKMMDIMTDLILADSYEQVAGTSIPDSLRNVLGDGVLEKYGVSRAQLDTTLAWYGSNIDKYYDLLGKVEKNLSNQLRKEGVSSNDDTKNDIWNLPRHFEFSRLASSEALVFSFSGQNLSKGDMLEWEMTSTSPSEAELLIGIDYTDGTSSISNRTYRNERRLSISLPSDTGRLAERIYGVLQIPTQSMPAFIDSITLSIQTPDTINGGSRFMRNGRLHYGPRKIADKPEDLSFESKLSN